MGTIRRNIGWITYIATLVGSVSVMFVSGVNHLAKTNHLENLYQQASGVIRSLDGEAGTSSSDWARAYHEVLGLHYETHSSDPRELSEWDLQSIVDNYSSNTITK